MARLPQDIKERLLNNYVEKDGCWEYKYLNKTTGYGALRVNHPKQRLLLAHREMYKLLVGDIEEGKQIDHLCRNRRCVNPQHLEPVSARENLLRSKLTKAGINSRKTHCINGHEFTKENTYTHPKRQSRDCRECRYNAAKRHVNKKLVLEGGYTLV